MNTSMQVTRHVSGNLIGRAPRARRDAAACRNAMRSWRLACQSLAAAVCVRSIARIFWHKSEQWRSQGPDFRNSLRCYYTYDGFEIRPQG